MSLPAILSLAVLSPVVLSPVVLSPVVLATVVGHLAPHFLAVTEGDLQAARQAASDILAAYNVGAEDELAVAAEIISLSFHALEALAQAANPDLPLSKVLRLRGSAVSLSRESHKARRRLDQLQRTRLTAAPIGVPDTIQPPAQPVPLAQPEQEPAPANPIAAPSKPTQRRATKPPQAWTIAHQQRHAAQRITENLQRNQAEHAHRQAAKITAVQIPGTNQAPTYQAPTYQAPT